MEIIVLVDQNWAIGCCGELLVRIKKDLRRFQEITLDSIVIYGRKTMETFPNGEPLADRENWVLSRTTEIEYPNTRCFRSVADLLAHAKNEEEKGRKVYVIGGASVYDQLLPFCSAAEVTMVNKEWEEADVWFPELTDLPNWVETERSELQTAGRTTEYTYAFVRFENTMPMSY